MCQSVVTQVDSVTAGQSAQSQGPVVKEFTCVKV